jgi:hypothetical protein
MWRNKLFLYWNLIANNNLWHLKTTSSIIFLHLMAYFKFVSICSAIRLGEAFQEQHFYHRQPKCVRAEAWRSSQYLSNYIHSLSASKVSGRLPWPHKKSYAIALWNSSVLLNCFHSGRAAFRRRSTFARGTWPRADMSLCYSLQHTAIVGARLRNFSDSW